MAEFRLLILQQRSLHECIFCCETLKLTNVSSLAGSVRINLVKLLSVMFSKIDLRDLCKTQTCNFHRALVKFSRACVAMVTLSRYTSYETTT